MKGFNMVVCRQKLTSIATSLVWLVVLIFTPLRAASVNEHMTDDRASRIAWEQAEQMAELRDLLDGRKISNACKIGDATFIRTYYSADLEKFAQGEFFMVLRKADRPALYLASLHGHVECVKALFEVITGVIERKKHLSLSDATKTRLDAEIRSWVYGMLNYCDENGQTALHKAVLGGHNDCVEALLGDDRFFDVLIGQPDKTGKTAVHLATQEGKLLCVSALVKRLRSSLYGLRTRILKELNLVQFDHVHSTAGEGNSALRVTLLNGFLEMSSRDSSSWEFSPMTKLIEIFGLAPLIELAKARPSESSLILFERLGEIFENWDFQCHEILSKYINAKDEHDQTVLHNAALSGHSDCLITLINEGLDQATLFKKALALPRNHLLKFLKNSKALIGSKDNKGKTALQNALDKEHWLCAEFLLSLEQALFEIEEFFLPIDLNNELLEDRTLSGYSWEALLLKMRDVSDRLYGHMTSDERILLPVRWQWFDRGTKHDRTSRRDHARMGSASTTDGMNDERSRSRTHQSNDDDNSDQADRNKGQQQSNEYASSSSSPNNKTANNGKGTPADSASHSKESTEQENLKTQLMKCVEEERYLDALFIAMQLESIPFIRMLIKQMIIKDVQDKENRTPLHYIAERGNVACATVLLDEGLKLEAVDCKGNTPLHVASLSGNVAVLKLFLGRGAEIKAVNKEGWLPLHCATAQGHIECIKTLLDNNSPLYERDIEGQSALHIAVLKDQVDALIQLLKKGSNTGLLNNRGQTVLVCAAELGHYKCLVPLLEEEFTHAQKAEGNWTPLHQAAMQGYVKAVQCLLENRVSTESVDSKKRTPLHVAVMCGHNDCVRALMVGGAKLDASDGTGSTPFHLAVQTGQDACLRSLVEKRTHLNSQDNEGLTPLHWAVKKRSLASVKILLDAGANTQITDKPGELGRTAYQLLYAERQASQNAKMNSQEDTIFEELKNLFDEYAHLRS